jgi:hypothetical protein
MRPTVGDRLPRIWFIADLKFRQVPTLRFSFN